jgi:hypothetical protein
MRSRKFWFLALFLLLAVSLGSAELTVYEGDSVTISDANSTIIWGQDYTFDVSNLYFHDTALGIGTERNISITSDTDAKINSTLNAYDYSAPSAGETVFRFETDAATGSQLDFRFTDVPSISEGEYRLRVDGENLENFSSGGTISWSYGSWSSNHSFELALSAIDFKITWNDTSDNEDGFKIYSNSTGSFQQIGTVDQNVEQFVDSSSSLEFGETVCYRVRAYNQFGRSPPLEGCATP